MTIREHLEAIIALDAPEPGGYGTRYHARKALEIIDAAELIHSAETLDELVLCRLVPDPEPS